MIFVQNKSNIELEMKTFKQNFDQEKLAHEEDLARFNAAKKDLIVSKEEPNMQALKGLMIDCIVLAYVPVFYIGTRCT